MANAEQATNALFDAAGWLDVDAMRAALEGGAVATTVRARRPKTVFEALVARFPAARGSLHVVNALRLAALHLLAAHGARPGAENASELAATALREGCSLDVVQHLVGECSASEWRGNRGSTMLHFASLPEQARELLAAGVPAGARNADGQTALHTILIRYILFDRIGIGELRELVSLLVAAGTDIDAAETGSRLTLLHRTVTCFPISNSRRAAAVSCFLRAGADPTVRDAAGDTPFEAALRRLHKAMEVLASVPEHHRRGGYSGIIKFSHQCSQPLLQGLVSGRQRCCDAAEHWENDHQSWDSAASCQRPARHWDQAQVGGVAP